MNGLYLVIISALVFVLAYRFLRRFHRRKSLDAEPVQSHTGIPL